MDQRGPLNASIVEAFDRLPPQLQTAARYMLDRPDDVALLSMREQARRAGVPPATMTRLAKRLGLDGYDSVRELYAGAVRAGTLASPARRAFRSRRRSCAASARSRPRWRQSLSRQIAGLAEPAALDRLADAASRLHEARRIYCLGLRSCHAAAWHFHYMLSLLGDKTVMLDDAGGTGLDAIRDAGHGRRPAGGQRRALCPRHDRGRALCRGPRRARRGAHRIRKSRRSPRSRATRSWWRPTARPSSTR